MCAGVINLPRRMRRGTRCSRAGWVVTGADIASRALTTRHSRHLATRQRRNMTGIRLTMASSMISADLVVTCLGPADAVALRLMAPPRRARRPLPAVGRKAAAHATGMRKGAWRELAAQAVEPQDGRGHVRTTTRRSRPTPGKEPAAPVAATARSCRMGAHTRSLARTRFRLHAREHVAETSRHCRRSQARGAACLPAARGTQGGTRPLGAKAEAAPRPASARRYVRIVSWRVGGRRGTRGGRRVSSEKSGRVLLGKSQNLCGRPCATMSRREGRPG